MCVIKSRNLSNFASINKNHMQLSARLILLQSFLPFFLPFFLSSFFNICLISFFFSFFLCFFFPFHSTLHFTVESEDTWFDFRKKFWKDFGSLFFLKLYMKQASFSSARSRNFCENRTKEYYSPEIVHTVYQRMFCPFYENKTVVYERVEYQNHHNKNHICFSYIWS